MNVFKKITMFILLVCMTFSFAACTGCTNGGGGGGNSGGNQGGSNPPVETPDVPTQPSQSVDLSAIVGVYQPATLEGENKTIRDRIYNEIATLIAEHLNGVYNNGEQEVKNKTKAVVVNVDAGTIDIAYKYNVEYVFAITNGLGENFNTQEKIYNKIIEFLTNSDNVYQIKFGLFDNEINALLEFIKKEIITEENYNKDVAMYSGSTKDVLIVNSNNIKDVNKNGNQFVNGFYDDSKDDLLSSESSEIVRNLKIGEIFRFVNTNNNYGSSAYVKFMQSGNPNDLDYVNIVRGDSNANFKNYAGVLEVLKNKLYAYLKTASNIPGGSSNISSSGFLTAPIVEVEVFNVGYYEIEGGFEDLGIPDAPKLKVPYLYNDNYSTKDFGDDNTNKYVLPERNWLTLYFCTSSSSQNNFWLLGIDAIIKKDEGELSDAIKNCDVSITSKTSITSFDYANTKYKTSWKQSGTWTWIN